MSYVILLKLTYNMFAAVKWTVLGLSCPYMAFVKILPFMKFIDFDPTYKSMQFMFFLAKYGFYGFFSRIWYINPIYRLDHNF